MHSDTCELHSITSTSIQQPRLTSWLCLIEQVPNRGLLGPGRLKLVFSTADEGKAFEHVGYHTVPHTQTHTTFGMTIISISLLSICYKSYQLAHHHNYLALSNSTPISSLLMQNIPSLKVMSTVFTIWRVQESVVC